MNIESKPSSNWHSPAVLTLIIIVLLLPSPSASAQTYDPWRETNQRVFAFNDYFDQLLVRPLASTYTFFMPRIVRQGIGNFFSNVRDVNVAVNDLLQFKFEDALQDSGRVLVNSTIGIGGVIDVASGWGLEKHEEDFGQTLGAWGVGSGPYLVLPVFGASNLRDSFGLILDTVFNPLQYIDATSAKFTLFVVEEIDSRAALLALDELISGYKYLFIREAYVQNREYLVNDGEIEDEFGSF
ncbi:MAG: VacJ family lipoprotein [Gammaproteobacteria bacterium]|nr:VacJ family lipoprotein [Gammaproteobacteria bacterium]